MKSMTLYANSQILILVMMVTEEQKIEDRPSEVTSQVEKVRSFV